MGHPHSYAATLGSDSWNFALDWDSEHHQRLSAVRVGLNSGYFHSEYRYTDEGRLQGMASGVSSNGNAILSSNGQTAASGVTSHYYYQRDSRDRIEWEDSQGSLYDRYQVGSYSGLTTRYSYSDRGELTEARSFQGTASDHHDVPLPDRLISYSYDSAGNRTQRAFHEANSSGAITSTHIDQGFSPNSYNQLTGPAYSPTLNVSGTASEQATVYIYGANQDNPPPQALPALRQGRYFNERLAYAVAAGGAYEDDLQIVAHVPNPSGDDYVSVEQRTAEVRQPSPTVNYDADGNITFDSRWTYTWDALNRLVRMQTHSASASNGLPDLRLEFAYDHRNRRIEKEVYLDDVLQTHHRFLYNGMDMIAEVNMEGGVSVTGQYHWRPTGLGQAGRLLLASVDGEAVLAGHNGRGNVTSYSDAFTGDLRIGREYTPFGETIRNTVEDGGDQVDIPFGFKGEYLDKETGLIYHGHRYYDPHWGRFISRDPIGEAGGANLYAYAENDPVNKRDLWGLTTVEDEDANTSTTQSPPRPWADPFSILPRPGTRPSWFISQYFPHHSFQWHIWEAEQEAKKKAEDEATMAETSKPDWDGLDKVEVRFDEDGKFHVVEPFDFLGQEDKNGGFLRQSRIWIAEKLVPGHYGRNALNEQGLRDAGLWGRESLTANQLREAGFELMPPKKSVFHDWGEGHENNQKWLSDEPNRIYGRLEIIIDGSGNQVTDPRVMGSYNYGGGHGTHAILDVVPYFLFGNSPDDPTNIFQRIWRTTEAFRRE